MGALIALLSSCFNLRYTDYGRPFDFLKAKKINYHAHKVSKDTAAIFITKATTPDSITIYIAESNFTQVKKEEPKHKHVEEKTASQKKNQHSAVPETLDTIQVTTKLDPSTHEKTSHKNQFKSKSKNTVTFTPKGWWEDFWEGFWNFILKWLLIFLVFFVVLALVIWGIYLLITLIGGPIAGSVFLLIVCLLFYILLHT
jgi:hypothetical protein